MSAGEVAGADAEVAVDVVDAGGAVLARGRRTFVDFDLAKSTDESRAALANELLTVLECEAAERGRRREEIRGFNNKGRKSYSTPSDLN